MSYRSIYRLWAFAFVLTAALGFIPNPSGVGLVLLRILSLAFFLPPALILIKEKKAGTCRHRTIINRLSLASLAITLFLLVANVMSAGGSQRLGNILYVLLTILSAPMECSKFYALSLFCWAFLMIATFPKKK